MDFIVLFKKLSISFLVIVDSQAVEEIIKTDSMYSLPSFPL